MSKRSKKENELLNYLSEDERKVYEEFEAKLKAKRDVAVKRQKKEINFCCSVLGNAAEIASLIPVNPSEQRIRMS